MKRRLLQNILIAGLAVLLPGLTTAGDRDEASVILSGTDIEMIRMEMTALENLKRIHTHLKRIAREIVPEEVRSTA